MRISTSSASQSEVGGGTAGSDGGNKSAGACGNPAAGRGVSGAGGVGGDGGTNCAATAAGMHIPIEA